MNRIGGHAEREAKRAQRRLQDIAGQHAAVGVLARGARAGLIPAERALMLIEAIVDGHALPHWVAQIDGSGARLTITANPEAPPEIARMLEKSTLGIYEPEGAA